MEAEIEKLISGLPDSDGARRFLDALAEKHPRDHSKLCKKAALLSDVATLAAFSPLLAATMLQNPDYLWWLDRERSASGVRDKDELGEALARFSLTHSQLEPQVLFARFRRRELLRIYLRDIRRLSTIAEITEEISNLADVILDSALKLAGREMDNRFGQPLETDEKGKSLPARFCIAALGKLGSRELNYSSDIDLIFLYSNEGNTSGRGTRGTVTNREYFVKLAEYTTKLVGEPSGEGAAYRVDVRLRPHGTLGALALSDGDMTRYYESEARGWERQVMIRSRGCAGDIELFKEFFASIEGLVFSTAETVETSLANVRRSKEKIDRENINRRGFNVKLGRGGIREIEFIAQALQLAYGGADPWLRSSHTLISIDRLADRKHISAAELTQLAGAYELLRRTEHILQMENGVQTHTVPDEPDRRSLVSAKLTFTMGGDFERDLKRCTTNVHRIFNRVFGEAAASRSADAIETDPAMLGITDPEDRSQPLSEKAGLIERITRTSPHFAAMLGANPKLASDLSDIDQPYAERDHASILLDAVRSESQLGPRLAALRQTWSTALLEIAINDIFEKIDINDAKRYQTDLAEASIAAALEIVRLELAEKYHAPVEDLDLAILALGKLGGRGLDYGSDLDLLVVYDDSKPTAVSTLTHAEYYTRAVEVFVTALSAMTRDGNLYRIDLRLRPYGSKGLSALPAASFLDYLGQTAVIWEMLAFVKLRVVGGNAELGDMVEREARHTIHDRAAAAVPDELREETLRVRHALEKQRSRTRRSEEIDIKYGSGGMLDVYFAMRYLQLRDNIPDDTSDRSTTFMLDTLRVRASLTEDLHSMLADGYQFLSTLDHHLRLTVGRTTRVPLANRPALEIVAARMSFSTPANLLEQLTLHRLNIRSAFDSILAPER